MNREGFCDICATQGTVRPGLVAWREPISPQYENVDRCVDEAACRARVEAAGDEWPVIDPRRES